MRMSVTEARKLGIIGKERKPRKAAAANPGETGPATGGRTRHARVSYAEREFRLELTLPYDPRPKERPRSTLDRLVLRNAFLSARGNLATFMAMAVKGAIRTYTPERTLEYEELLKAEATAAMMSQRRKPFDVPLEADIHLTLAGAEGEWPTSALDGDGDNLQKAVLDALNGVVFTDDRLFVRKSVTKVCGAAPKLVLSIRPADPAAR